MKRIAIGDQGEVTLFRCEGPMPAGLKLHTERDERGRIIIAHSERGHHHVIEDAGAVVMEQTENVPVGMRVFWALLERPTALIQNAPDAHGAQALPANLIQFRIKREYDPFSEQVRRVAD
jgi:hypothetical protein